MSPAQSRRFRRLLLTGAAGALGTVLREHLPALADVLRVSDRELLDPAREREQVVPCDLGDAAGMEALTRDVDAVVHMGGVSGEAPFADLHHGNILGMYHLFEGCRKNGVGRAWPVWDCDFRIQASKRWLLWTAWDRVGPARNQLSVFALQN